jgi:hypothetical protein
MNRNKKRYKRRKARVRVILEPRDCYHCSSGVDCCGSCDSHYEEVMTLKKFHKLRAEYNGVINLMVESK